MTDVLPVGASESPGSFWLSKGDDLYLQRLNGDGVVQESFVPEGTQFVAAEPEPGLMSDVFRMQFHDGLLWIWMNVADAEMVATRSPMEPYARHILEVVDPDERRVLASIEVDRDRYFSGFIRGDTAVFIGQNELGFQTTEFVVAKLVER